MKQPLGVFVAGDALVDFLSVTPEATIEDSLRFEKSPGGSALNCAVIARRLGAQVSFSSALGSDVFGRYLISFLGSESIDTTAIYQVKGASTGVAFASSPRGSVQFHIIRGDATPASKLTKDHAASVDMSSVSYLHLCSLLVYQFAPFEYVTTLVESAQNAGTAITFDPNVRPHAILDEKEARRRFDYFLKNATIVKMSDEDARWLYPDMTIEAICKDLLQNCSARIVIVTKGPHGATGAYLDNAIFRVVHVDSFGAPTGDTVGAGDAFMGALLSRFSVEGVEPQAIHCTDALLKEYMTFASAASFCVCSRFGALAGLQSEDSVRKVLPRDWGD